MFLPRWVKIDSNLLRSYSLRPLSHREFPQDSSPSSPQFSNSIYSDILEIPTPAISRLRPPHFRDSRVPLNCERSCLLVLVVGWAEGPPFRALCDQGPAPVLTGPITSFFLAPQKLFFLSP